MCIKGFSGVQSAQEKYGADQLEVLLLNIDKGVLATERQAIQKSLSIRKKMNLPWMDVLLPNSWDDLIKLLNSKNFGITVIDKTGTVRGMRVKSTYRPTDKLEDTELGQLLRKLLGPLEAVN